MNITKCEGEGLGSCKMCEENGKWNISWMCFLYNVEGYEGHYCFDCVRKIKEMHKNKTLHTVFHTT